ncbi:MAG: penicillin-binding protein activator LpoB [Bacteroidetes bacterium]|nr:penicillin-binding protein activator LpoB [Bacteroidota bacterium]
MNTKSLLITGLAAGLLAAGCTSTEQAKRSVSRVESDKQIDLSGKWNDTDSRLVAEDLLTDALNSAWLENQDFAGGTKPVITVGTIKNKTAEHIDVSIFIKDIQRAVINSQKAKFVASKPQKEELRDERREQQQFAREETVKQMAAETGADVMLQGQISSIIDQYDNQRVIFYQVDLEAVNIESGEIIWQGQKKIKKFIDQDKWQL